MAGRTSGGRAGLPSFGELVLTWIDYVEQGVYAIEPEDLGAGMRSRTIRPDLLALGVA
jgi:hypothetical protein